MEFIKNTNGKTSEASIFKEIQGRSTARVEHVEIEVMPSINSYLL